MIGGFLLFTVMTLVEATRQGPKGGWYTNISPCSGCGQLALPANGTLSFAPGDGSFTFRSFTADGPYELNGTLETGDGSTFTAVDTKEITRCQGMFLDITDMPSFIVYCHDVAGIHYSYAMQMNQH